MAFNVGDLVIIEDEDTYVQRCRENGREDVESFYDSYVGHHDYFEEYGGSEQVIDEVFEKSGHIEYIIRINGSTVYFDEEMLTAVFDDSEIMLDEPVLDFASFLM